MWQRRFAKDPLKLNWLYMQSQSEGRRPSEVVELEDRTAAYLLDRSVWMFGSWFEGINQAFRMSSKKGNGKNENIRPSEEECDEFRRAILHDEPYSATRVRAAKTKRKKKVSLADFGKRGRKREGAGRTIEFDAEGKIAQSPSGGTRL